MEGVEYIEYSGSPKLWVEECGKGKAICGGGHSGGGGRGKCGRVK
jgi:hypothetical protein